MAESMKDFEQELEASFKKIDEGDIITGTVVSVDETGVVLDLKYYVEDSSRQRNFPGEPGFNMKRSSTAGRGDSGKLFLGKMMDRKYPSFKSGGSRGSGMG